MKWVCKDVNDTDVEYLLKQTECIVDNIGQLSYQIMLLQDTCSLLEDYVKLVDKHATDTSEGLQSLLNIMTDDANRKIKIIEK